LQAEVQTSLLPRRPSGGVEPPVSEFPVGSWLAT